MEQTRTESPNERNPVSHRRHRKEVFRQITLPVLIGGMILLACSLLATQMEAGETSRWADISLIWLIAPLMLLTLISLAMLVASIYATIKIIHVLPIYFYRLHRGLIMASLYLRNANNRMVEPVLRLNSFSASLKSLKRQLRRR